MGLSSLPPPPHANTSRNSSAPAAVRGYSGVAPNQTPVVPAPAFTHQAQSKGATKIFEFEHILAKLDDSQRELATCTDQGAIGEAFAGAGKTTTAVAYASLRPSANILYLCLNKQNQLEAQSRFPAWVTAKTTHGLAYGDVGRHYKERLVPSIRVTQFAAEHNIFDMAVAASVQGAINAFTCSADMSVSAHHAAPTMLKYGIDEGRTEEIVNIARRAWMAMESLSTSQCSVTHDTYLKVWAAKKPSLSKYSHIIVDEAQDSNPVVVEVLRHQSNTRLYIGDRHQSIYQFRGSVDAISKLAKDGARVIKIPRTWRFGPQIAASTNRLLHLLKGETTEIIGAGPTTAKSGKSHAFLARTNAGLIEQAVARRGKGIHWVGGIEKYAVDVLLDAWNLKIGQTGQIRDAYMRSASIKTWGRYVELARLTKDTEALRLIKLVDQYGKDIPQLVNLIKASALNDAQAKMADISITTAHQSKGLEWDSVTLGDDFCKLEEQLSTYLSNNLMHLDDGQEINMLYVAMTRARHEIFAPADIQRFLTSDYDKHARAVHDVALSLQRPDLPASSEMSMN